MSKTQSIIFNKAEYTQEEAEKWLAKHHKQPIKHVDITKNYYRYRMKKPDKNKYYRLKEISNGLKLVLEFSEPYDLLEKGQRKPHDLLEKGQRKPHDLLEKGQRKIINNRKRSTKK